MSDSPPPPNDPSEPVVRLRRRTDAERIDYLMYEYAALSARHQALQRDHELLKIKVKKLEEGQ